MQLVTINREREADAAGVWRRFKFRYFFFSFFSCFVYDDDGDDDVRFGYFVSPIFLPPVDRRARPASSPEKGGKIIPGREIGIFSLPALNGAEFENGDMKKSYYIEEAKNDNNNIEPLSFSFLLPKTMVIHCVGGGGGGLQRRRNSYRLWFMGYLDISMLASCSLSPLCVVFFFKVVLRSVCGAPLLEIIIEDIKIWRKTKLFLFFFSCWI